MTAARKELDRIIARQRLFGGSLLSDPAWEILLDLADAGSLKTSAVGAMTRIPATTALRYLARLEAEGLIERANREADQRLSIVSLTERGAGLVAQSLQSETA